MTDPESAIGRGATRAIIDIGSNTVRLVVYGGPPRAPAILLNEKVTAKLGKGVAENGRLAGKASANALAALARYRTLLDLGGVRRVDVVATAAVRDASNGAEFLDQVRALGLSPRLLSGTEEAETSALGVIGAFPGVSGIVADLGGGSLELVDIAGDTSSHGVSLPLGTLRLAALRDQGDRVFARKIGAALKKAEWGPEPDATLYLVGGSLRAFARAAMVHMAWPMEDTHGFTLPAADALKFARSLARKGARLTPVPGLSAARAASLPDAAALLAALIVKLRPGRLVFSSWGLREGVLFSGLDAPVRAQDPLLAGASLFAAQMGIAPATAAMVAGWTAGANVVDTTGRNENLRLAATMLCLAAGRVEPNLRADLARDWGLRKRWIGIDGEGRAMLAAALHANAGQSVLPAALSRLASAESLHEARAWGYATRLCRRFSACSAQALSRSRLRNDDGQLLLSADPDVAALIHDGVRRDLKLIAGHLGLLLPT